MFFFTCVLCWFRLLCVIVFLCRHGAQCPNVDLVFTKADRQDVVPHDNDPVVILVVTAGRRGHRIQMDLGSSNDVMFWSTFNKLQLRPYISCLYVSLETRWRCVGT